MFSADLAALITILSKDADETVLLAACGVTSIFKIFLLSSSEAAVLVFLGDSEKKDDLKTFFGEFYSFSDMMMVWYYEEESHFAF